jgi:hypothetical protein
MSMHLEGPWLTTTGKVKSKRRKFANAEAARKSRELAELWQQRQVEWDKLTPRFSKTKPRVLEIKQAALTPKYPPGREPEQHIPSLNGGVDTGPAIKAPEKIYTGTKIKGIGTMHKSNAVPIFSDEEAQDIAKMRR